MYRYLFLIFFFIGLSQSSHAQQKTRPRLVVGIVVDQMRQDFVERFSGQFGADGFNRLLAEGFECKNVHFNYIPTYTGPGHASVFSGTTPAYHGVVGNDWYDRNSKRNQYCVTDSTEQIVGLTLKTRGSSARQLLGTNLADEMKIFSNHKAKVISISMKDRASILPAGHMADAAYWLNTDSGAFVSSTYYLKSLPEWLTRFNKGSRKYLQSAWTPLMPAASYPGSTNSGSDFSYPLNSFSEVYNSPAGDVMLTDLALEVLQNEDLGNDAYTDLLTISYSSPDAVGHKFGPLSKEVNDLYLRLDRDMARLLDALDKYVGKGNYLLFLTADHGVSEIPQYLIDHKVMAGYVNGSSLKADATAFLKKKLGEGNWIEYEMNEQFYLNHSLIDEKNLKLEEIQDVLATFLRSQKGIFQVFTAKDMQEGNFTTLLSSKLQAGYFFKRSGDVLYTLEPGWTEYMAYGTTHGSGFSYDSHVPLIWFGSGIPKGGSYEKYDITDIVASVALRLGIKLPAACTGQGIIEILK